jgi:hypothetical protein
LTVSVLVHVVVLPVVEQEVEQVPALPVDAVSANKAPMHNNPNPLIRILLFLHQAKNSFDRHKPNRSVWVPQPVPPCGAVRTDTPGSVYHIFFRFPGIFKLFREILTSQYVAGAGGNDPDCREVKA